LLIAAALWHESAVLVVLVVASVVGLALLWPYRRNPSGKAVALSLVLGIAAGNAWLFRTNAEDAFITYRYALNLADGHGPVFNLGERVEGYSNFLWMALLAAVHAATGLEIEYTARALGLVAALGTILLTYRLVVMVTHDVGLGLLAGLLLGCTGSFAAYGVSGLETPLFALLLVGMVCCLLRPALLAAGLLAALAIMTRPDGLVLVAPVVVWLFATASGGTRDRLGSVARFVVPLFAVVGPWTVWRLAYYGHLVPNTLAAKTGGLAIVDQAHEGLKYVNGFVLGTLPLLAVGGLVIAMPFVASRRPRFSETHALLLALVGTLTLFVIAAGGDWMVAWRLLAPAVPLLIAFFASFWNENAGAWRTRESRAAPIVCGIAAIVLLATSFSNADMIPRVRIWSEQVDALAQQGDWFRGALGGSLIATYANGALSYHAGPSIEIIDMLGLTDEHIARHGKRLTTPGIAIGHRAYDDRYVVHRRPDVVVFSGGGFSPFPTCGVQPAFTGSYVGKAFRFTKGNETGAYVNLLLRADEADRLTEKLLRQPGAMVADCP
jgi:arabinofuranosyltransferase